MVLPEKGRGEKTVMWWIEYDKGVLVERGVRVGKQVEIDGEEYVETVVGKTISLANLREFVRQVAENSDYATVAEFGRGPRGPKRNAVEREFFERKQIRNYLGLIAHWESKGLPLFPKDKVKPVRRVHKKVTAVPNNKNADDLGISVLYAEAEAGHGALVEGTSGVAGEAGIFKQEGETDPWLGRFRAHGAWSGVRGRAAAGAKHWGPDLEAHFAGVEAGGGASVSLFGWRIRFGVSGSIASIGGKLEGNPLYGGLHAKVALGAGLGVRLQWEKE
ncbi:MAG: hypothetical protein R6U98_02705 [Pirellulaceae bacterium]